MRSPFILTVLVAVGLSASADAAVVSGPVTNPANGRQYYLLSPTTWTAAEAEGSVLGGHLVTINDAAENDWVSTTFGSFNSLYWIGLSDAAVEGDFRWSSGDPSAYRNWYPNNPGNSQASWDYVALLTDSTRKWMEYAPQSNLQGIIEVVPEPTAAALLLPLAGLALMRRLGGDRPSAARRGR
jgi:hypothetical protein